MDKATYQGLNTEDRISFLNAEMAAGKKLWIICKELGIANNITTAFRHKGYVRNEEGLFIKHDPQHPGQMNIDHLKAEEKDADPTPKRVGRPPRTGKKPKKLTIEIDPDVYKALMFYKIDQELYVNGYIEELIKKNVPSKYFDML